MPQQPQAPFISSTEAAKRFNLTNDHIGLLCRKGKVQGTLLGRLWFVSEPSLAAYVQKNAEAQATRRTQLSKQWSAAWMAVFFAVVLFAYSGGYAEAAVPVGAQLSVETVTAPLPEPSPIEKGTAFINHSLANVPQVKPIAAVALAPATARPHAPTLRIVHAKRVVNGVLESPGAAAVATADSGTTQAMLVLANEKLGAINDAMFGIYTYAVLSIWKIAVFEANAIAYVADKTFGEFGRRFVHDVYALGDTQARFYMQSAAALEAGYNDFAETLDAVPAPESSISVANACVLSTFCNF